MHALTIRQLPCPSLHCPLPAPVLLRFREDVALQERMDAIGHIIEDSSYPTFLCFQVLVQLHARFLMHMCIA